MVATSCTTFAMHSANYAFFINIDNIEVMSMYYVNN